MKQVFPFSSYLFWGLVADLLIISAVLFYFVLQNLLSCNGKFPSLMDGPAGNCTMVGAIMFEFAFFLIFVLVYYWQISVPLLFLPLILGLTFNLRKLKK